MPLMTLRSDLSWYGSRPFGFRPNQSREQTDFKYNDDLTASTRVTGFSTSGKSLITPRIVTTADAFPIDTTFAEAGSAKRKTQRGNGSVFPIGPAGQVHKFDTKRTGWYIEDRYGDTFSNKTLTGLAATYTANSPIDDMYNRFKVRDEVYDPYGYAKTPFILRGIQREGSSDPQRWGLGGTTAGVISGLLDIPRGGPLTAGERAAVDVARIGKFLIRPNGLAFIAKQQLLHLMSPNTENVTGGIDKFDLKKIYNPANTLLSVAGNGIGSRFRRYGLTPIDINPAKPTTYGGILKQRKYTGSDNETTQNRLVNLYDERKSINTSTWLTISALGGPDSVGGIGATNFTRYENTSLTAQLDFHNGNISMFGNRNTLFGRVVTSARPLTVSPGITTIIPEIRTSPRFTSYEYPYMRRENQVNSEETENALRPNTDRPLTMKKRWGYDSVTNSWSEDKSVLTWSAGLQAVTTNKPPQPTKNIDTESAPIQRYKTLDYPVLMRLAKARPPGTTTINDFRKAAIGERDTNYTDTLESKYGYVAYSADQKNQPKPDPINNLPIDSDYVETKDLIKFRFAPINATNLANANGNIIFRAYLTNLSDNFSPSWDGAQDQGRADAKVRYTSFERTIDLAFKVVVHSAGERKTVWDKLSELAKITYPKYAGGGFHGIYVKVTIGDLYVNQPMFITSLGYDWDTESPWEITDGRQLPMYTDVNMALTWIGERRPSYSTAQVFSYK